MKFPIKCLIALGDYEALWMSYVKTLSSALLHCYLNTRRLILEKLEKKEIPMPTRGWDITSLRPIQLLVTSATFPQIFFPSAPFVLNPIGAYSDKDEEAWLEVAESNFELPTSLSWQKSRLLWVSMTDENSIMYYFPQELLQLFAIKLESLTLLYLVLRDNTATAV